MNPAPLKPDASTYTGRLAARLRSLREEAGLSVEDLIAKLAKLDATVAKRTVYHWESGRHEPPIYLLPKLSKIYKLKSPRDILPEK